MSKNSTVTKTQHLPEGTELNPVEIHVSAETIHASVIAGVGALGAAFYEPEQRILADNGTTYPVNASLPDGVADSGSIVVVNRYRFIQSQLLGGVCWKAESMLADCTKRLGDQRAKIAQAVRQLESGRGAVTETMIDRMADWCETLVEQQAMLRVAFDAACEAYADVTETDFETAEMRASRKTAESTLNASNPEQAARLARLGVR